MYLAENVAERCVSRVRYALRGLACIAGGTVTGLPPLVHTRYAF